MFSQLAAAAVGVNNVSQFKPAAAATAAAAAAAAAAEVFLQLSG